MGSVLSLLGAGGSILTMPILVYLFSIPAVEATSYSLLLVGLTALMGSIGYFRQGTIDATERRCWRTRVEREEAVMVMDALKGYVQLATGLTEVTAAKARDAASALVNQGMQWTGKSSDAMESVQDIADDLLVTSQQNREALMGMIRTEVDRAVGRLGFVREDELYWTRFGRNYG